MAKSITFVTGKRLEYDLCLREQSDVLDSLKDQGLVELGDGIYWVPDLNLAEKNVNAVTSTRGK